MILPLLLAAMQVPPVTVPLGADLERFAYPRELRWFTNPAGLRMAYLDFPARGRANGRTIVLLHGKNFCAATWEETARALAGAGYRVIAPDQIGFCKSAKPADFQYSFAALATLTRDLLHHAGAEPVTLVGHSTGGILAVRMALLYPREVPEVVLVNPLGLSDTIAEGVPYAPLATLRAEEAKTSAATIRAYQQRTYYAGQWRPAYERWVQMLAGQYASPRGGTVREAQARLSDMIQTQPVVYEFARMTQPVTLLIGSTDTTAFRANTAPAGAKVRTVPQAAEEAVRAFRQGRLVRLPGLGHAPQVEDPVRFQRALLEVVARSPTAFTPSLSWGYASCTAGKAAGSWNRSGVTVRATSCQCRLASIIVSKEGAPSCKHNRDGPQPSLGDGE